MVLAPKPFAPVKKEEIIRFENFIMKLSLQFFKKLLSRKLLPKEINYESLGKLYYDLLNTRPYMSI